MVDQESLKNLENLHRLKTEGVITEAEFEKAKGDLLNARPMTHRPAPKAATSTPNGLPLEDDHVGWAMRPLKLYADFSGRATRKEFWTYTLAMMGVSACLAIIFLADTNSIGLTGAFGNLALVLLMFFLLGTLIPTLAVQVRRFHDQDWSGWFVLLNLIPYVGAFIVLLLLLQQGTSGTNRFGPNPYAPEGAVQ